jgi:5-enolpyruvylshikimate-3-phosphate synthase
MIGPVESWPWRALTLRLLDRFGGNLKLELSSGQSETRVGALDA